MCFPLILIIIRIITCSPGVEAQRGHEPRQLRNQLPTIRITQPADGSIHSRNAPIRYSIAVSDPEDGESEWDEIPSDRIFLRVQYVKGAPAPPARSSEPAAVASSIGFTAIRESDCFNCHRFRDRSIGPSFAGISKKHAPTKNNQEELAKKIIHGSRGEWGGEIMPAHPDLSEHVARYMVDWILTAGASPDTNYLRGKAGIITLSLPQHLDPGHFVLTAFYTDKGVPGHEAQTNTVEKSVIILVE